MMKAILTELVIGCPLCDEVACERDLLAVESEAEAEVLWSEESPISVGDIVCRDCAAGAGISLD